MSAEISIGMQSVANLTEIYRNWVIYVFVYQINYINILKMNKYEIQRGKC